MRSIPRHESAFALAALAAALACIEPACAQPALAASPAVTAYGQAVSVELKSSGIALYRPGTRYTRNGSTIEIEYDYLADTFGPFRPDFGETALALGELAPGNYQVHARLHDIAAPGAAPVEVSMQFAMEPPEDWGIYVLPRAPQAFSATSAIVRSAVYFDPSTMRARLLGNVVRVDFDYHADAPLFGTQPAGTSLFAAVPIPGLAPGAYRIEGWARAGVGEAYELFFARAFQVAATVPVVEFYSNGLGHYFIAAGADEIALLDRGQGDWKRTGQQFAAWLRQSDAPAGAVPVCRFYASGPNSHFYTGSAQECAYLRAYEQQQRAESSGPFIGWAYEATAFWAAVPVAGVCPGGTSPVYRAYNDRFAQMDSNHRFMASAEQRDAMSVGWLDEGVQLCSAS